MFFESLREHTMEIANFKRRKKEVFNKRAAEIISKYKHLLFFIEKVKYKHAKGKIYQKFRDHCHYRG